MRTKITSILLILAVLACAFAGCADESNSNWAGEKQYDYDLSKYVTVGNYKGLGATSSEFVFTDEDMQEYIAMILSENMEYVEVTDRNVENGDIVNIDFTGYMDGEAFEGGTGTDYDLTIGSGSFIDGFESALVGAEKGEVRMIDVTFPESYDSEELAGKPAQFEVTINSISYMVAPEYNEDFVNTYYPEYSTLDEFEAAIRSSAEEEFNYEVEMDIIDQLWAQIMENSTTIKYPEKEYQTTYEAEIQYYEDASAYYGTTLEDYISTYLGNTMEEFEEMVKSEIYAYLDEQLVLYYIIRTEKLELTEDEYKEGLAFYASSFGATEEELIDYYGEDRIMNSVQWEKVLKFVKDNAVITPAEAAEE